MHIKPRTWTFTLQDNISLFVQRDIYSFLVVDEYHSWNEIQFTHLKSISMFCLFNLTLIKKKMSFCWGENGLHGAWGVLKSGNFVHRSKHVENKYMRFGFGEQIKEAVWPIIWHYSVQSLLCLCVLFAHIYAFIDVLSYLICSMSNIISLHIIIIQRQFSFLFLLHGQRYLIYCLFMKIYWLGEVHKFKPHTTKLQ